MQMLAVATVGGLFVWHLTVLPDSASYIETSKMSLREGLSSSRTMTYPLLLKAVSAISPDYALIPWVHLAIFFLVVFLMDSALRRYGAAPWQAFAVSTGILWGASNWMIGALLTDFLGQMGAVATVAFLFWTVAEGKNFFAWAGLLLCLACSYHIRPAYLFLIPFIPCLGVLLLRIHAKWSGDFHRWKRLLLSLSAGALLPYLAYCLMRLLMVGHFGLVSFGGSQSVGFAVEFLDRDMIENEISERYRPFARELLAERERQGMPNAFDGNWRIHLKQWERNYNFNIFIISKPIVRRFYGNDPVTYNREVGAFSLEVIGLRKGKYLQLYAYSCPRAVLKLFGRSLVLQVLVPLTVLLFAVRRWMFRRRRTAAIWDASPQERGVLLAVFLLAFFFFVTKIALVLAVLFVDSRYALPAGIFVPGLFCLLILRELQMIRSAWMLRVTS